MPRSLLDEIPREPCPVQTHHPAHFTSLQRRHDARKSLTLIDGHRAVTVSTTQDQFVTAWCEAKGHLATSALQTEPLGRLDVVAQLS